VKARLMLARRTHHTMAVSDGMRSHEALLSSALDSGL
jgi:hypothetical protein